MQSVSFTGVLAGSLYTFWHFPSREKVAAKALARNQVPRPPGRQPIHTADASELPGTAYRSPNPFGCA